MQSPQQPPPPALSVCVKVAGLLRQVRRPQNIVAAYSSSHLIPLTNTRQEPSTCTYGMSTCVSRFSILVAFGCYGCRVLMPLMSYERIGIGNTSHVFLRIIRISILGRHASFLMLTTPCCTTTAGIIQCQGKPLVGVAAGIGTACCAHIGNLCHGSLTSVGCIIFCSIYIAVGSHHAARIDACRCTEGDGVKGTHFRGDFVVLAVGERETALRQRVGVVTDGDGKD